MHMMAAGLVLVAALAAPSFLGEWTATASTPGGDVSETLTVVKTADGYAITAKLVGDAAGSPTAGPGTDIVLDGNQFSYKRTIKTPDGGVTLTYKGVVSEDTFTGTAEIGGFSVPYTGVRVKRAGQKDGKD